MTKLNKAQKTIIGMVIVAVLLMCLFPPSIVSGKKRLFAGSPAIGGKSTEYCFIFDSSNNSTIEFGRLFLQFIIVIIIGFSLVYILRSDSCLRLKYANKKVKMKFLRLSLLLCILIILLIILIAGYGLTIDP